ncbi:peptidase family C78-domain-containing protein [Whalleya microplaca]|nr:peptidase family C78-domain-containing protein [Whalleya microplaca]
MANEVICPFCGYKADIEYAILLHMETLHPEGKSPFVPDETANDFDADISVEEAECPIDGCGIILTLAELDDHIELHASEGAEPEPESEPEPEPKPTERSLASYDDQTSTLVNGYHSPYMLASSVAQSSRARPHDRTDPHDTQVRSIEKWKQILHMPSSRKAYDAHLPTDGPPPPRKRLGKEELGKYAHENKMPDWLVSLLKQGGYESAHGIITVLEQLLEQNPSTDYAYLCHPAVQHISKLRREGSFCGYRNIQMLTSYIVGASATGADVFRHKVPSIFRIQDYIEKAWDMGINTQGRVETGGVKGTRKYIGTPEAQAIFLSLGIPCEAQGFKRPEAGAAEALLFNAVERYFESAPFDPQEKVRCTTLPPIYFQHRGHSLTIVGLEKKRNGALELLVFDPFFHDPTSITRYIGRRFQHRNPDNALKVYRRGSKYLKKYHEFEILKLIK